MATNVADLVATLKLDLTNLDKGVADVQTKLGKLDSALKSTDDASKKVESSTKSLGSSMHGLGESVQRVAEIFLGFSFTHIAEKMAELTVEMFKMAREANLAEYAFSNLAKQAGVAGEELAHAMQKASGDTLNMSDVLAAAGRGLQQALQPDQLVNLMEIARSQSILTGQTVGSAFNSLTEAIANQQVRALKSMGIVIDLEAAMRRHAESLGIDATMLNEAGKAQAIYNAVIEVTRGKLISLDAEAVRNKESLETLGATLKDIGENIGKFFIKGLNDTIDALGRLRAALPSRGAQGEAGFGPGVMGLPADLAAQLAGIPAAEGGGEHGLGGTKVNQVEQDRLDRLRRTIQAQLDLARALGGVAIAEAAVRGTTATQVEIVEQSINALDVQTAALLRNNDVQMQLAKTEEERGKAEVARLGIIDQATAKRIELGQRLIDAKVAELDVLAKLFPELAREGEIAARDIDIENARAAAIQASVRATKDLLAVTQAPGAESLADEVAGFGALAGAPPGGPGAQEAFLARGTTLATFQKTLRDSALMAKNLGSDFSTAQARIDATRTALVELSRQGLGPADAEVARLSNDLRQLTLIQNTLGTIFDGLRTAVSGTVQGILQGTLTVQEAFRRMGQNIAVSLVDSVINRGLKAVEKALFDFLADMQKNGLIEALAKLGISFGTNAIGAIPATSAPTLAPAIDTGLVGLAAGGAVVHRPSLFVAGEAGPEAIIPMPGGAVPVQFTGGGGGTIVNVINNAPGTTADHDEQTGPNGEVIHNIVIRELRRSIQSGEMDAVLSPYALTRQPVRR